MYWPSISWAAMALEGAAPTTSAPATSASETRLRCSTFHLPLRPGSRPGSPLAARQCTAHQEVRQAPVRTPFSTGKRPIARLRRGDAARGRPDVDRGRPDELRFALL